MRDYDENLLNLDALLARPACLDVESMREFAYFGIYEFNKWRKNPKYVTVAGIQYRLVEVQCDTEQSNAQDGNA